MKVLVADKISPKGVALLRKQPGLEVVEAYGSSPAKLLELVRDVHAIAVRSETKVTAELIAAAPLLKVVGRAGVGVDNVDVEAATERGVIVMNTPSGNTVATAELTFTHLLCGARPVPQAAGSMRDGKWDRKSFSGMELFRKTLGIIGLGRIGGAIGSYAIGAFVGANMMNACWIFLGTGSLIAGLVTIWLGVETKGQNLEQLTKDGTLSAAKAREQLVHA